MNIKFVLGVLGVILVLCLFFITFYLAITTPTTYVKKIDCGMAEWHPDIPPQAREECRKRFLKDSK